MNKTLGALLLLFLLVSSVHAADKIRISIANLSGQFMTFSLAHKRGFLKEEGIEAEIIRVTGGASAAAEWLKVNKEVAATTYDGVVKVYNEDPSVCEKGLRVMIEERKQTVKINRDVPLSEVADLSLIREAQRELGTKEK